MESLPTRVKVWAELIRKKKPGRAAELQGLLDEPIAKRDWVAIERVLKLAVGSVAAAAFEGEVRALADEVDGREPGSEQAGRATAACPRCGGETRARRHRERTRKLTTTLGDITFARSEYRCSCGHVFAPADDALGLRNEQRMSAHLLEVSERYGADSDSFASAARTLADWIDTEGGRPPSSSAIRDHVVARAAELDAAYAEEVAAARRDSRNVELLDWAGDAEDTMVIEIDGGAVPVRTAERPAEAPEDGATASPGDDDNPGDASSPAVATTSTTASRSKGSDGWREGKLGAIYLTKDYVEKPPSEAATAAGKPGRGRVLRCLEAGAVGHWQQSGFADELYTLALKLGLRRVRRVVLITDGAEWIASLKAAYFPEATHILDVWHAMEKLCEPARVVFGNNAIAFEKWRHARYTELMRGDVSALCKAIRNLTRRTRIAGTTADLKKKASASSGYLQTRKSMLMPAEHRAAGLPIGSGLIEGRIKTVIQARAKRPGMRWSLLGIRAILRLRCHLRNTRHADPEHLLRPAA